MRPFPDVIRIEPAGVCNFSCQHCPVGVEGGKRRMLSYDNFVRFFDMLPAVPRVLVLYHGGEPLLNKNLERMISYAKDKGVAKIVFNTNASLLSSRRDLSGVDELRVSFDGDSPADNNSIRLGSDFAKHAEQVRLLALSASRPRLIKIYNARHTTSACPAGYLLDAFRDLPGVVFETVKIRKWARLANEPTLHNGTTFCSNLMQTFTILSDGSVPMCCEDLQGDDLQGNVFQSTPQEIWERMEARREAFARRDYPKLCQSCWVTTGAE